MEYLYLVLSRVADLFIWAIIARAVLSWFPVSPYNPISVFLLRITEPLLAPLRRLIPRAGMLDITPLIAILVLQFVVKGLLAYLLS